jgi:hypothetical protein
VAESFRSKHPLRASARTVTPAIAAIAIKTLRADSFIGLRVEALLLVRHVIPLLGQLDSVCKMTKALHYKRPALVPMLDSVVQQYLEDDDLGVKALFGERAIGLVRGYKRELDLNREAMRAVRLEIARRGYGLTEVRILDLLIWSVEIAPN